MSAEKLLLLAALDESQSEDVVPVLPRIFGAASELSGEEASQSANAALGDAQG